jgi:hypothetical protein
MVVGILGIVIINLFTNTMITNEQDNFLVKEITEAAMIDAFDYEAYRIGVGYDGVTSETDPDSMHCDVNNMPGTIRIKKEKFVQSFLMRFAKSVGMSKTYNISFDDIDECPPKVAITITATDKYSFLQFFNINYDGGQEVVNNIVGILEEVPSQS